LMKLVLVLISSMISAFVSVIMVFSFDNKMDFRLYYFNEFTSNLLIVSRN
jgi:hypothetical protein